ncbi:MAG TPA: hypothetical protein VGC20_03130, partial [bacterium]
MPSSLRPVLIALLLAALLFAALPPAASAPAQGGAAQGGESALESGAVVLMYHRFGEGQYPSTSIRLE